MGIFDSLRGKPDNQEQEGDLLRRQLERRIGAVVSLGMAKDSALKTVDEFPIKLGSPLSFSLNPSAVDQGDTMYEICADLDDDGGKSDDPRSRILARIGSVSDGGNGNKLWLVGKFSTGDPAVVNENEAICLSDCGAGEEITIGRKDDKIKPRMVIDKKCASGLHCKITVVEIRNNGAIVLKMEDLNSTNGTQLLKRKPDYRALSALVKDLQR